MTRLIDADALKLSHCKECTLYPDNCLGENCDWDSIAHINMMPTVEAIPVSWLTAQAENPSNSDSLRNAIDHIVYTMWAGGNKNERSD